jgi:hypothetical protein
MPQIAFLKGERSLFPFNAADFGDSHNEGMIGAADQKRDIVCN